MDGASAAAKISPAATPVSVRDATTGQAHYGARVKVSDVSRTFETASGPIDAIREIDLSINAGQFCVIVGPSGCGKTTLLRIVAGLDQATTGSVTVSTLNGGVATNAMVFQGQSLFPWLTLQQNVSYGLKIHGMSRSRRASVARELLHTVGLSRFASAYPRQVSEGMRQRTAIARALAVKPDVLLMDEPFGSLDEQTRLILQEELLKIWDTSGQTVLFVTHSIDEALVLGDRIVIMSAQPGRIKREIFVPFPRPRTLTDVRSNPVFAPLFAEIWGVLREEVGTGRLSQAGFSP